MREQRTIFFMESYNPRCLGGCNYKEMWMIQKITLKCFRYPIVNIILKGGYLGEEVALVRGIFRVCLTPISGDLLADGVKGIMLQKILQCRNCSFPESVPFLSDSVHFSCSKVLWWRVFVCGKTYVWTFLYLRVRYWNWYIVLYLCLIFCGSSLIGRSIGRLLFYTRAVDKIEAELERGWSPTYHTTGRMSIV